MTIPRQNADLLATYSSRLEECRSKSSFKAVLDDLRRHIGMSGFTWWFGVYPEFVELDSRPPEFMKVYNERDMLFFDPILAQAALYRRPFLWSDIVDVPRYGRGGHQVMGLAGDFGIRYGVHFPVKNDGPEDGCLSFFTDHRQIALDVWHCLRYGLNLFAAECQRHSQEIGLMSINEPDITLTGDERETLILIARGLEYGEVGNLLCVTEEAIKDRMKKIRIKLDEPKTISAVRKALELNLIK